MGVDILQAVGLVLAGLLAGEEFIVRYGVQPALRALEDRAHIQARVALVRSLKVIVPILMIPTVLVGIAVLVVSGTGDGVVFRWAGVIALVAFVLFSFLGTVPINMRVNDWQADAPPAGWEATVLRWERIDVFRSSAAIVAFLCFVVAVVLRLP
ncbi:MAG: hypothetical protein QOF00_1403 [Pseudonocardiales bacterium]|nr:hypothetical protein [Pseudonocardiales bacterium]